MSTPSKERQQALLRIVKNNLDDQMLTVFDDIDDWQSVMDYDELVWFRNNVSLGVQLEIME